MKRHLLLFIIAALCTARGAGFAQADDTPPEQEKKKQKSKTEIVVSATKTSIDPKETGASITVITEEEMEQKGKKTVASALRDVPGLTVLATSPFGGLTNVFIRGAQPGNSIILMDGVRLNDPSEGSKSFDFAGLMADNIDRIEVIRGSQSVLYGSDAMGGVINIISKKGIGETLFNLWTEAGAYYTFREYASVSGGMDKVNYSCSISRTDSQGLNIYSDPLNTTTDEDGFSNTTISTNLGFKLFHDSWLGVSLRYINMHVESDDGAGEGDDPNSRTDTENIAAIVHYTIPLFSWWESSIYFSYMSILRHYRDPADATDVGENDDGIYKGKTLKCEWRNKITIGSIDEILIGAEIEKEFSDTHAYMPLWAVLSSSNDSALSGAVYAQNHLKLFDRLFLITGLRYTVTEYYGASANYSVSASFIIPFIDTRLKGNVSTGFKTPSLFQRFDPVYGNAHLDNENSISYDIGFEQPLFDDIIIAGAAYFIIQYTDLIDYNFSTNKYENTGEVESQGSECYLRIVPIEDITINTTYTYTWAINTDTDKQLLRRPEHMVSFNVNYTFHDKGNVNIGLNWIGPRQDLNSKSGSRETVTPYWRLDAAVSYWILEEVQVFARGENLLDQNYEEVNGNNTAGISFYGGLRVRL